MRRDYITAPPTSQGFRRERRSNRRHPRFGRYITRSGGKLTDEPGSNARQAGERERKTRFTSMQDRKAPCGIFGKVQNQEVTSRYCEQPRLLERTRSGGDLVRKIASGKEREGKTGSVLLPP